MGFKERMLKESEKVYQRIQAGELTGPESVDIALMDAHFNASAVPDDDDQK